MQNFTLVQLKEKGIVPFWCIFYVISQFPLALSPSASRKSVMVSNPLPHLNLSEPLPPVNSSSPCPAFILSFPPAPDPILLSPKLISFPFPLFISSSPPLPPPSRLSPIFSSSPSPRVI